MFMTVLRRILHTMIRTGKPLAMTLTIVLSACVHADGLFTFAFPGELRVDYGDVAFGTERPRFVGMTTNLDFRVCDVMPEGDRTRVVGLRYDEDRQSAEVWTALTTDVLDFSQARRLFRLPRPDNRWLAGDVVLAGGHVVLLICDQGRPAVKGHRFHCFSGQLDGTGWKRRNDAPIYRGQDAFGLAWDKENKRFINYQTAFQKRPKRYADNMGNDVRRVLHIRTSPDGLAWTPGGSFGVAGPYLPEDQLITPDEEDPGELEFYKFRPMKLADFWAGGMVNYVPQPTGLPRSGHLPHGPFLNCEWWVSRDGMKWERPFRHTSDFEGVLFKFCHFAHPPIPVRGEYRWLADEEVYALHPDRMFFIACRANAEVTTPVLHPVGGPMMLQAGFESVRLGRKSDLRQGYLMVELRTADDQPIDGFPKEHCRFLPSDKTAFPLRWNGTPLPDPTPRQGIRLKLYFRDMRIYSLRY